MSETEKIDDRDFQDSDKGMKTRSVKGELAGKPLRNGAPPLE